MSDNFFFPGQRWVSNSEAELGLGIVIEIANRRVEMSFPAAGERRTYAIDNAPLNRVRYEIGQVISTSDDQKLTVKAVTEKQGCLFYNCEDSEGVAIEVPELELNSFVQFSKPQDRLFAGQIDKNKAFDLRCKTLELVREQQLSPVRGLLGPRVQLLPHQLYIASETANRHAPRVLLADEVGLGKTIEAGLILHQQLVSGRAKRALIVVPDSLVHQWLVEMLRRFNLYFTILDEERCEGLLTSGSENPFESTQLALCSLSFLANDSKRLEQAVAADWDLLIVDEAHHLQWSEAEVSPAYQAIEAISRRAKGLLLLTATPEQLGIESHFARLRLLDPDRYYDLATFCEEEARYQPVNDLVQQLLADDAVSQLSADAIIFEKLEDFLGRDEVQPLKHAVNEQDALSTLPILKKTITALLDRHGTGRVLFRNTRSSVKGFPDRVLQGHQLVSPASLQSSDQLRQLLAPEQLLGSDWLTTDPRVEWLAGWLKQHRANKVLVICASADTALDLEEFLRLRRGVHSSVFHEGLSLVARDRAAAYFSDHEEGAQVLICSEIGSEGRNFQFSHQLVLFDLPINPDLLEQRIGRLDRIGQKNTVEIHVPYYLDSAQHVLLRWYHEGLNAFERTCPVGQGLFQQFSDELNYCLQHGAEHERLERLITETRATTEQLLLKLQQGRDRLLELNSCDHEKAEQVVALMVEQERSEALAYYMEQMFDQFGVDQEHHSSVSVVLRPGDHMVSHSFPALPEDGLTATFYRDTALSREDMHYITWEHPMVSGAMDMVLSSEFGNTAFCTLKLPPLKPGTIILEAIFTINCSAPSELQLQRYLPLTTLRVVVDSNQNNLSKVLTPVHFQKLAKKVARRSAQDLMRHARAQIVTMIEQAEKVVANQQQTVIDEARQNMQLIQHAELERMKALATVNPNIRQEEVAFLQQTTDSLDHYLQSAQLRLDAVRVALITD